MAQKSTLSVLGNLWVQNDINVDCLNTLKHQKNYPYIISDLLASRGIGADSAEHFLTPTLKHFLTDPFALKDVSKAVDRLVIALHQHQNITIYGDYDVDGATSTALFVRFFRMLGAEVSFYIPDRQTEGYGPNTAAFQTLAEKGTNLIITVDCGTLAFEPIAAAKKLGVDVIVVDHHGAADTHPDCFALINPNRKDENSHLKHLAAVGVSFMVCVAIVRTLREQNYFKDKPEPDLMSLLDIVALGTVCDVVPLVGLNRAFVAQGIKVLKQTRNKGLLSLMQLLNIDPQHISPYHLGFVIGPRINAGGRIGTASLGTQLLSSDDAAVVKSAAEELNVLNEERRQLQDLTLLEADLQVREEDPVIVVSSPTWHQGVIGIVAGRLKDKYNKPTFVIAIDPNTQVGKGSARSIVGFDVGHSIHLAHQQKILSQGGGHPMAGGFSLPASQISAFVEFMKHHFKQCMSEEDLIAKRMFDSPLTLDSLTLDLYEKLEQIGPFGSGNPTPKFVFTNVILSKTIVMQEKHIRCFLTDALSEKKLEGLLFQAFQSSLGDFLLKNQGNQIDILGTIKKDDWNGRSLLKIYIEDIRSNS